MMERIAIYILIFQAFHKHVVSGLKQRRILDEIFQKAKHMHN